MNKKIITGIVIAVVVIVGVIGVLWWMFFGRISMNSTNSGAPTVSADPNTIIIKNFAYGPDTLTVPVGTTVTWINEEFFISHDVKADTFQSPRLKQGEKFSFTFTTAGTFNYICSIHPTMVGKIVVQ